MAKIPFEIKYWPQIESGEYKVETRDRRVVHNIWRVKEPSYTNNRKMEVCALIDGEEDALVFFEGGRYLPTTKDTDSPFDLFIVTSGPEMTAFEKKVYAYCDGKTVGEELIKRIAKELLALAREQFIKDGYVIEKKAFYDAVENISDKHLAEMSVQYSTHCKIEDGTRHAVLDWSEFHKVAQKFIDIGKEEALKDLPRWIDNWDSLRPYKDISGLQYIVLNGKAMNVSDLSKLPGFKEDEK